MRLKLFISFFIPFFLFCQAPQDSNNNQVPQDSINVQLLASDKQRSWCISQFDQWDRYLAKLSLLDDDEKKWFREFQRDKVTTYEIYSNDNPNKEISLKGENQIKGLLSNDNDYLRYCKILADINDIE